jgi:dCTP deaminase
MFLPHDEIVSKGNWGELISKHFDENLTKQASYDLRLGEEIYLVGKRAPEKLSDRNPYVSLPPGQFAILTCYEEIKMPDTHLAFIALKTTFKFQGLVNISGFHVDPTHEGTLLFAVQNVGPADIRLKYKEPTFQIFFAQLLSNKIGHKRSEEATTHFKPKLKGIRLEDVQMLGGSSVTLSKLQKDLHHLRTLVAIYGAFAIAALAALLVNLLIVLSSKK